MPLSRSSQMPEGTFTRTWAHPETPAQFACLWGKEVRDARALGRRVGRALSRGPLRGARRRSGRRRSRDLRLSPAIPFEPAMLDYTGAVDVSAKPHQQRLLRAADRGRRDWRDGHARGGRAVVRGGRRPAPRRARLRASSRRRRARPRERRLARAGTRPPRRVERRRVRAQRSPLWRRRHPRLSAECFGSVAAAAYAMSRPFSEKKYVRSVAMPGVYLPSGMRQAIDPSVDAQGVGALLEGREEHVRADDDGRAEHAARRPTCSRSRPRSSRGTRAGARRIRPRRRVPSATAGVV